MHFLPHPQKIKNCLKPKNYLRQPSIISISQKFCEEFYPSIHGWFIFYIRTNGDCFDFLGPFQTFGFCIDVFFH